MESVLTQGGRWRELGRRVAVATVVATRRSAPRPIGSKLIVSDGGELAGSVSGGCVESDVVLAAQEVLAGGGARLLLPGPAAEERGRGADAAEVAAAEAKQPDQRPR